MHPSNRDVMDRNYRALDMIALDGKFHTFMFVQVEVVGDVDQSVLEVSGQLVDLNILDGDSGEGKLLTLVQGEVLLPQGEYVHDALPDHPESWVADGGLVVLEDGGEDQRNAPGIHHG